MDFMDNYDPKEKQVKRELREGKLTYIDKVTLPTDASTSAQGDQFTETAGSISVDRDTNNISNGNDYCEIDGKVYIFDHSNHEATLENLTDGDGFGIRTVLTFGEEPTRELLNSLQTIRTDGRFATKRDIDEAVGALRAKGYGNSSNNVVSNNQRATVADASVASQNDGRGDGQEAGVRGDLASSGENQGDDTGRGVTNTELFRIEETYSDGQRLGMDVDTNGEGCRVEGLADAVLESLRLLQFCDAMLRMVRLIRFRLTSTSLTITRTFWLRRTTSLGSLMNLSHSWLMWTSPS